MKIGFIGAGNMAEALITGFLKSGSLKSDNIIVSNYNKNKSSHLVNKYGVKEEENQNVINESDIVFLAVKPYLIKDIINTYNYKDNQIIISVAAGVSLEDMYKKDLKIVRTIPNMPVQICAGIIGCTFGNGFSSEEKEIVKKLLSSTGIFVEVSEDKIDAVSVIGGCSPAYMYQIIEALSDAGVRMGLSRDMAMSLASSSMYGSAKMVIDLKEHPAVLKDKVTSPAGTTIEGIYEMEACGVRSGIMKALNAAYIKTKSLLNKK